MDNTKGALLRILSASIQIVLFDVCKRDIL